MLNEKQMQAVKQIEGPLLILAGAGSGKTTVLTHRVSHMIKNGISPENILMIAFTNKASEEMKNRIENLIGEGSSSKISISTFHRFCMGILSDFGDRHKKVKNGYQIVNTSQSRASLKEYIEELSISEGQLNDDLFKPSNVLKVISLLKNEMFYNDDIITLISKKELDKKIDKEKITKLILNHIGKNKFKNFYKVFSHYESFLRKNNFIDLEDILNIAAEILEKNPDVLEFYQEKFKYIMIDEFQDTNQVQSFVFDLLASKYENIAAVGDDNQSIFGFRGSDIRNIWYFEKRYPNATIIKLEENFRSTQNILKAANELIKNNKDQKEKLLFSSKTEGEKIKVIESEFSTDEAKKIVSLINEYVQKGFEYKQMAVFYRNNNDSLSLERVLKEEKIPYHLSKDGSFFDQPEIVDILKFLIFLNDDSNVSAFKRIVNKPKRSIGNVTINKIIEAANGKSILNVCENIDQLSNISSKTKEGIKLFLSEIYLLQKKTQNISSLIEYIFKDSSYSQTLTSLDDLSKIQKMRNLNKFLEESSEILRINPTLNLSSFLDLILKVDIDAELLKDEQYNEVNLTTVHSAKGREFDIVFIIGFNEGSFPSEYSLSEKNVEEERRLAYVALTRAKSVLYLSHLKKKLVKEDGEEIIKNLLPSRFLGEIPGQYKENQ